MFESVKALEIKTAMIFNLGFVNDPVLLCLFFFFLIIDLYFLLTAVTTQIFNLIAELIIPMRIKTKEAKAKWKHIQ